MNRLVVALLVAAIAAGSASAGAAERPSPADLEAQLVCPTCHTTLDQSDSPVAQRMKAYIRARIAAGASAAQIKRELVDQFGPAVLATPRKEGFDLLAWVLPLAALAVGLVAVGVLAPCVLPLVPGYLSAVSAVDADRLGEPGNARRVVTASIPFVAGFSAVFVLLGTAAALIGGSLVHNQLLLEQVAGFVLVVFGLAFMGLLPWPERLLGAGLLQGARRRGSTVLLGGAFAVCAAPCIGPVLAAILVLAGSSGTALEGAVQLAVYSLGLAVPFVLAGAVFTRAMGAFRWLRDHYQAIQIGSGAIMVALGLLLFFGRFYWLRIYLNRFLGWTGLDGAL